MSGGFEFPDIGALMRQAQAPDGSGSPGADQAGSSPDTDQAEGAADEDVVGTAGGGAVTVTLGCGGDGRPGIECAAVHIDPSAIDPADPSLVEDLVMAAINDALGRLPEDDGPGAGSPLTGMLAGLSGLPDLLSGAMPALGANLPDLLSSAMEALGLAPPQAKAEPETSVAAEAEHPDGQAPR